jgi:hypothetical protein
MLPYDSASALIGGVSKTMAYAAKASAAHKKIGATKIADSCLRSSSVTDSSVKSSEMTAGSNRNEKVAPESAAHDAALGAGPRSRGDRPSRFKGYVGAQPSVGSVAASTVL